LDIWCAKGYDYIGAPWPDNSNLDRVINNRRKPFFQVCIWLLRLLGRKKDWRVGNGGFALHHIKSSVNAIKKYGRALKSFHANEDLFWGIFVPLSDFSFRVPDSLEAACFAIEQNPELLFELNNQRLPFGCHAWLKYNPEFWKQWIHYERT
jgi:hypothetical protein